MNKARFRLFANLIVTMSPKIMHSKTGQSVCKLTGYYFVLLLLPIVSILQILNYKLIHFHHGLHRSCRAFTVGAI
ncbi:hypothetical protein SAMN05428947_104396 [Mucilaginibacter sp. OK283]|nr:hypothetical protein SAMN05428947_104396 [Mucilaginibacter sp. OK283]